jgi:(p)ppGpp synthase/HD superfamily hydrolase
MGLDYMEEILQKVKEFARQAHGDQRRKFIDEPYINHPIRVMEICRQYDANIETLSAALLHDVLEDTVVTADQIKEFLLPLLNEETTAHTIKLIKELTDVYTKKSYPGLNRRERKDKERERLRNTSSHAQTIKYADIIDNSTDIKNLNNNFAKVFLLECRTILKTIMKGDQRLYKRAVETVEQGIEEQSQ